jgi:hypothetical protein
MSWAWYDGKVSAHHYQEEHGLDSEALLAATRAASHLEDASALSHGNGATPPGQIPEREAVEAKHDA